MVVGVFQPPMSQIQPATNDCLSNWHNGGSKTSLKICICQRATALDIVCDDAMASFQMDVNQWTRQLLRTPGGWALASPN